jgi:hypothetical protein
MRAAPCVVVAVCLVLAATSAAPQQIAGLGLPLLVEVPSLPNAVRAAGVFRLVYELHLTNTGPAPVTLTRIEVLDGEAVVATVEGDELASAIKQTAAGAASPQTLASGAHAVSMLWLSTAELPRALPHRIAGRTTSDPVSVVVEHGPIAVAFAPLRVGPPLEGGPWLAVSTSDGVPDNVPANRAPTGLTLETIGGNTVVLDLGSGLYAFYAHLQPGSIRVRPGQSVRAGEVLASVGNSGNSNAPHLHFQIGDGPTLLFSDGVPFVFDSFMYDGAARFDEIPLDGWQVSFD